jgi:hypothetical protein
MPGEIELFEFEHDSLFMVYKTATGTRVLTKMNLLTDSPGGAVFFDNKFIDLRLDSFTYNPTLVYDAINDVTKVCFKDGFEDTTLQPCVVSLDTLEPGIVEYLNLEFNGGSPVGQRYYVELDGDQTTKSFALGYQYTSEAVMPAFYVLSSERKDTLNIPYITRLSIDSSDSGPFEVTVTSQGREPFSLTLPQTPANLYPTNTLPILRNAQNKVPIMAKGTEVELSMMVSSPFPASLTSLVWEGTYNNKGIRSI